MVLCFVAQACIENDLSYPDVHVQIDKIDLEGMENYTVDYNTHVISVLLGEQAEISAVRVNEFILAEKCSVVGKMPAYLDLREPYKFKMKYYLPEDWTIIAAQPIERYIKCEGQISDAVIDADAKFAYVKIADTQNLGAVTVNDMKLEPEGSVVQYTIGNVPINGEIHTVMEECSFPMTMDCTVSRIFRVLYKGQMIEWTVTFLSQPVAVGMTLVNPWTYSAEVEGVTNGQGKTAFQYRKNGEESWTDFTEISYTGTTARATITGLEESADYQVRLTNGTENSDILDFRTGEALQLENMSFDTWHQADPKNTWYPFAEGGEKIWGTANPGTNKVKTENPTRPETEHVVKGTAARMQSIKVLGVFAAGNLFTGEFANFDFSTMTAYLKWGTPFKGRPYSLKGYYDYAPKTIDMTQDKVSGKPNPYKNLLGSTDNMQILVVLFADDDKNQGPYDVLSTKPGEPDLQTDSRVIAYGAIESPENTGGQYKEFECVLKYRDNRIPDYAIVVACSSLRGDFFTGGTGSVLYVDEFRFEYK